MKRFWLRRGLRFFGFALVFVGLAGLAVMSLWNALLPSILGVSKITFLQALGLMVLSRLLFGGPGWRGGWQGGGWNRSQKRFWKQRIAERWRQMTPEQREQLKARWKANGPDWCRGRGRWDVSRTEQPDQNESTTRV